MADKRMFSLKIIDSDSFLDMPVSTQNLYFHLSMRADDDGFINKPKTIMRITGTKDDDMKLLVAKKFIIPFKNGVVVIKHWKIHNYIKSDRYKETTYKDQKATLIIDKNGAYKPIEKGLEPERIQNGTEMDTQYRLELGKVRLGKDSSTRETDISDIIQVYENEIGMMTLSIAEDINYYLEELNKDLIIVAIQEASKNNARTWNYIKAILENMKKENIQTVADFKNRKKPNKNKPENKNKKVNDYDDLYE